MKACLKVNIELVNKFSWLNLHFIIADEDIKSKMNAWRAEHITEYDEVLAKTDEVFSAAECIDGECAMGNFLVDVYFQYHQNNSDELNGTRPDMAFLNTGAIRATLSTGSM